MIVWLLRLALLQLPVLSLPLYVNPTASSSPIPGDPAHPFPSIDLALAFAFSQGSGNIVLQLSGTLYSFPATPLPIPLTLQLNDCVLTVSGSVQVLASLAISGGILAGTKTDPSLFQVPMTPLGQGQLVLTNVTVTGVGCVFIGVAGGSISLISTTFIGNTESIVAVVAVGGLVSIQRCIFQKSRATAGIILGIATGTIIHISDCTFTQNEVTQGGVVQLTPSGPVPPSSLTISHSVFATLASTAILSTAPLSVQDCSFTALAQAIASSGVSSMLISDCTFQYVGICIAAQSIGNLTVLRTGVTASAVGVLGSGSPEAVAWIEDCQFWGNANNLTYSPGVTLQGFKNATILRTRFEDNYSEAPPNLYLIQCPAVILSSIQVRHTVSPLAAAFSLVSSNALLSSSHFASLRSISPFSLGYASQLHFLNSIIEHLDALDSNIVTGEVNTLAGDSTVFRNLTCTKELFQVHSFLADIVFRNCVFEDVASKSLLDEEPVQVIFEGCVFNFTARSAAMVMVYTTISDFYLRNCLITGVLKLVLDVYSTGFVSAYFLNVTFANLELDGLIMSISTSIYIQDCVFKNVTVANFHRYFLLLS